MKKISEREKEQIVERGITLFKQGYNCAQSTVLAMAPYYHLEEELAARMVCGLGAGMGRMREQCGTATGIFVLAGLETSSSHPSREGKAQVYAAVQELARRFREEAGSLTCRDLLSGYVHEIKTTPVPDERTDHYYRSRPCVRMVEMSLRIFLKWMDDHTPVPMAPAEVPGQESTSR